LHQRFLTPSFFAGLHFKRSITYLRGSSPQRAARAVGLGTCNLQASCPQASYRLALPEFVLRSYRYASWGYLDTTSLIATTIISFQCRLTIVCGVMESREIVPNRSQTIKLPACPSISCAAIQLTWFIVHRSKLGVGRTCRFGM